MKWLKGIRSLYLIPRRCDVCDVEFDIGYAVTSDSGVHGDVCSGCVGRDDDGKELRS